MPGHLVFALDHAQIVGLAKGVFMRKFLFTGLSAALAALAGYLVWDQFRPKSLGETAFAERYVVPLTPPSGPLPVYHLGHSLVGRDMPVMLAQMARHDHASQLGWGASLKGHWTGDIPGFAEENAHPGFRPAAEAVDSGEYAAVVFTEMVEIRDAIRYFDTAKYLAQWAIRARATRPDVRIYLYETWHRLDDAEGWLNRLDQDTRRYWEGEILRVAMAREGVGTIHVIPGGQVMAAAVRAIEAGQVPGLSRRDELFATAPDGTTDPIHFNDIGAWLMAVTHHAVIYHRLPDTPPSALRLADGKTPLTLAPETAKALQRIVWDVVTGYALTGVSSDRAGQP